MCGDRRRSIFERSAYNKRPQVERHDNNRQRCLFIWVLTGQWNPYSSFLRGQGRRGTTTPYLLLEMSEHLEGHARAEQESVPVERA